MIPLWDRGIGDAKDYGLWQANDRVIPKRINPPVDDALHG